MTEASNNQLPAWKSRLELLATILLIVVTLTVGGFALSDRLGSTPTSTEIGVQPVATPIPIPVGDTPVKGSRDARVALVLFSDFECPFCARTELEVMPQLKTKYIDTGKVLFVWRHLPLPIHASARATAEATECAGRQGKFWELHDWAFAHQRQLSSGRLRDAAQGLGVGMAAFEKCLDGEATDKITSDVALAKQLDVTGTPTWFIGSIEPNGTVVPVRKIVGLGPVDVYSKAIDKVLQSQ